MKRYFFRAFAVNSVAWVACCTSGVGSVQACDHTGTNGCQPVSMVPTPAPTPAPEITCGAPCSTTETQTIIVRLQTLVVPVSDKVQDCQDELAAAKRELASRKENLAASEQSMVRGMEKIVAIKELLSQDGCHILVAKQLFSRESVAEALRHSIQGYKNEVAQLTKLSLAVVEQKKVVDGLIAKVQRWQQAEKDLLSEVARLQVEQKSYLDQSRRNLEADAQSVAAAIETMLENANKSSGNQPVVSDQPANQQHEVLTVVDSILQGKS